MPFPARSTAGALCWIAAAPFFLAANVVVGLAWQQPSFNWSTNNISDLGNVSCGVWDTATRPRYICSPWHDAMNAAFVLAAVLLIAGLILSWRAWGDGLAIRTAQRLMLLGAAGLGLAGLFPADQHASLHMLAALMVFGCGNAGLVLAGLAPRGTSLARLRGSALTLGVLGLVAAVLFLIGEGAGLGIGTMERIAVFPLLFWCCFAGCFLYFRARANRSQENRPATELVHQS